MKYIYICSPYRGDVEKNVSNALKYCREVVKAGAMPICPHIYFTQFLNDDLGNEREIGLDLATILLTKCDELWQFGTPSSGMKSEIAVAQHIGIPIKVVEGVEK